MKDLNLNPQNHEIELSVNNCSPEDGVADISFKFLDKHGSVVLNADESARIGDWFIKLSKAIKRSKKK